MLALRQQLGVLKRKRSRPRLDASDRLFWVLLLQLWSRWAEAHHCKPRHRRRLASCRSPPLLALEVPAARWPTEKQGGNSRPDPAPGTRKSGLGRFKIHGELQKLGFAVSERSVARYLRPMVRRGDPDKEWLAFLPSQSPRSHRRLGPVHRADGDVPSVVLPFRDRAWTASDPALQRHTTPVGRPGGAAAARVFSRSGSLSVCHPGSLSIFDADVIAFLKI